MGILHKKKQKDEYEEEPEDQEEDLDLDSDDLEEMEAEAPKPKKKFPEHPKESTKERVKEQKTFKQKLKATSTTQSGMIIQKLVESGWLKTDEQAQEIVNEIALYRERVNRRKLLLEDLESLGMLEEQ